MRYTTLYDRRSTKGRRNHRRDRIYDRVPSEDATMIGDGQS